ncbi:MAG: VIT1/CCC1 transporter family protein [Burkholderiaceae bacterium]
MPPPAFSPPPRLDWRARLQASVKASFGEIVFGMEDGTISIFGLVFGLAVTAHSAEQVLIVGATGAIVAAVSMAAGVFLDYQSERDQAQSARRAQLARVQTDPQAAIGRAIGRLQQAGLSPATLAAVRHDLEAAPERVLALGGKPDAPTESRTDLMAHSAWMFLSDLIAGLTPVLPFAFLPTETARIVCIGLTVGLLVALGVARARIGERPVLSTVAQTVAVAGAAGVAGVVIARMLT